MFRASLLALFAALVVLSGGLVGQDPKKDGKKTDDQKKVGKADDPAARYKGVLPRDWRKLGLSDTQVQQVYKTQNKYNEEIDKLEAKIKELKSTRDKEVDSVLTPDQKKRLADIRLGKEK